MTRQLITDHPSTLTTETADGTDRGAAPKAGALARVAAFVAGVLMLVGGTIVSLGMVLLAPIGMAVAGWVQRRRGDPMTRGGHWIAASAAIVVALVLAMAAFLAFTPKGTMRNVVQAADSASVASAKEPPPAWLERLGPGLAVQQPGPGASRMFTIVGGLLGVSFMVGLLSAVFGTLGWSAGMLLGLALSGRWPGSVIPGDDLAAIAPLGSPPRGVL